MIQLLLIVGASIFVLLGTLHGVFSLQDIGTAPRNFTPRDEELRRAMQQATVAFHPKINLWLAWLGFNLSHSLGLIVFGGAALYIAVFYPSLFSELRLLPICFIAIAAIYLVLSLKFWFSRPAIFVGISLACFVAAWVLSFT